MKTTKLILAIAFFAFSTLAFSQTARPDVNKPAPTLCIKTTLSAAMHNVELVKAMKVQVSPDLILLDQKYYIAKVSLRNVVYVIWGKKEEWKLFFNGHAIDPSGTAG
jgi:hypothetical protein